MNEKVFTAWFPECCAPTLITRDMAGMAAFMAEHGRVVCKPLYGMGGRSIFVLDAGDKNANVVFETLTEYGSATPSSSGTSRTSSRRATRACCSSTASRSGTPSPASRRRMTTAATSRPAPRASAVR